MEISGRVNGGPVVILADSTLLIGAVGGTCTDEYLLGCTVAVGPAVD